MSDLREFQRALLGGIIARYGSARLRRITKEEHFDTDMDRAVFRAATAMSALGKDRDENYVIAIADTLRYQGRAPLYLRTLLQSFLDLADEHEDWTLEELARSVAAQKAKTA